LLVPTREGDQWAANSSYRERPRGVSQASLDRFVEELSTREIAQIESLLRPRMARWGYPLRSSGRSPVAAARWVLDRQARRRARRILGRSGRPSRRTATLERS
jgi:hypothetical protein